MSLATSQSQLKFPAFNIPRFTEADLVRQIAMAMENTSGEVQILAVKTVLAKSIRKHPGFLPERFCRATAGHYARRLLYSDPDRRFSILVMTWGAGQGTCLHDHGGTWVVECVYRGRIRVTNYDHLGEKEGLHQFRPLTTDLALPGAADHRMPPEEHHILENDQLEPSVTIHVFGGSMESCNAFEPVPGGYRKSLFRPQLTVG